MTEDLASPKPVAPVAISLRSPSSQSFASANPRDGTPAFEPPTQQWLAGTWIVTHSTLPMWKKKCNVRITYTARASESTDPPRFPDLDDLVEYQGSPTSKTSTVNGISRPVHDNPAGTGWAFKWRGKGWLKIASSDWEILGWGEDKAGNGWAVTYFQKTLFTPAGIDVYSRKIEGVDEGTLKGIKEALRMMEDAGVKMLAESIFEIPRQQ